MPDTQMIFRQKTADNKALSLSVQLAVCGLLSSTSIPESTKQYRTRRQSP